MILFVVPFIFADGDKLKIVKITAYVDGDKDTGTIDVKPGSILEIKVKVENLYDEDIEGEDLDIEDIVITATIDEIDDGDELEEEADEFDLDAEEDDTETIQFEIPWEVDDDSFDLSIEVEGEDENGTMHYATDELVGFEQIA